MVKKTKTVKTVKKGAAPKTAGKALDENREALAKELRTLIPKLDSKGLAFLIEQARVHLYNMQVDELNKAAVAANTAAARSQSISAGSGSAGAEMSFLGSKSGSSFYLRYRNSESMFARDEIVQLVKIVNGRGSDLEIRERLYNWFERERKDVFATVPMADKFDDRIKKLALLIKNNFKLSDRR